MKETAPRPVKMKLGIYGNGNYNGISISFATVYMDDALSQNILYDCYEQSKGVEELAKIYGVTAYYIEERIDFYKAEKSEDDLFYLYGMMAFAYASVHYSKLPNPDFKKKYDGHAWCYLGNMETGKHHRIGIGTQMCSIEDKRGGYSHTAYHAISGIEFRPMMYDNDIRVCADVLFGDVVEDIDSATAIQDGYIVKKQDGRFFVTVPFFTKEQKAEFDAIADKYLASAMPAYSDIVNQFIAGYKKLFPKHLQDDADRMRQNMFMGLYAPIIEYAQRTETIKRPSPNCYCDVLIQFGKG